MATSTLTKANDWVEYAVEGANCDSDTFKIALSDTAPSGETNDPTADGNGILANITQIDYTNYSDNNSSDRTLVTSSSSQTGGTYKLVISDLTITASGGSLGPFRYVYVVDDTVTDDPVVGYYDYGTSITLSDGESLNLDFDDTDGIFYLS